MGYDVVVFTESTLLNFVFKHNHMIYMTTKIVVKPLEPCILKNLMCQKKQEQTHLVLDLQTVKTQHNEDLFTCNHKN